MNDTTRVNRARVVNVVLGAWLFISAFAWPHTNTQMMNAWIIGVLCVILTFVAMNAPSVRYLNTALSVWLFISALALQQARASTVWNNVLVAIAMFLASLVRGPNGREGIARTSP
jgi:hypothetical protein